MADDVMAPNTKIEEADRPITVQDLLDKALYYVPSVGGVVWAVWAEDQLVGYLEMSTTGYLLRDKALLDESMVLEPRKTFFKWKADTLHVDCLLRIPDHS